MLVEPVWTARKQVKIRGGERESKRETERKGEEIRAMLAQK